MAFLARPIDGEMKFEKADARLLKPRDEHFNSARFFDRLHSPPC